MPKNKRKTPNFNRQIRARLGKMKVTGVSRHADKMRARSEGKPAEFYAKERIYSDKTFNNYIQFMGRFAKFAYSQDPDLKNMEDAKKYVVPWLNDLNDKGRSAWTLSSYMAAVNKFYQTEKSDWKDLKEWKRDADDIVKNRDKVDENGKVKPQKLRYNPKNYKAELTFSRCFGLRDVELRPLKMDDITVFGKDIFVEVPNAKGGKERTVKFYGTDEERDFILKDLADKERRGFKRPFASFTPELKIHRERQIYADRVYEAYARDVSTLSSDETVIPRTGHNRGHIFDREALLEVSRALGHNRQDVAYKHYLGL